MQEATAGAGGASRGIRFAGSHEQRRPRPSMCARLPQGSPDCRHPRASPGCPSVPLPRTEGCGHALPRGNRNQPSLSAPPRVGREAINAWSRDRRTKESRPSGHGSSHGWRCAASANPRSRMQCVKAPLTACPPMHAPPLTAGSAPSGGEHIRRPQGTNPLGHEEFDHPQRHSAGPVAGARATGALLADGPDLFLDSASDGGYCRQSRAPDRAGLDERQRARGASATGRLAKGMTMDFRLRCLTAS